MVLKTSGEVLPAGEGESIKLRIKDAEGMKKCSGVPSPYFGEQRKDDPKAKNARFQVNNVVVGDNPIELYVEDKKVAEVMIERRNRR